MANESASSCKVVLAQNIAKSLLQEVKEGVERAVHPPHLLGILANTDPAAQRYADWTRKTCEEK